MLPFIYIPTPQLVFRFGFCILKPQMSKTHQPFYRAALALLARNLLPLPFRRGEGSVCSLLVRPTGYARAGLTPFLLLFAVLFVQNLLSAELLPPGFRPLPLGVHALVGGKVVIKPGEVANEATVVIRYGFIQAVGKDVVAPEDARIWDMKGRTIYAGFIDPY